MFTKFAPHAKLTLFAAVLMGSAYLALSSFVPGGARLPSGLQNLFGSAGDGGQEAVEIAVEHMTRVYRLQARPPSGGRSLGHSADGRFWVVSVNLGPGRSHVLCVVEPDGSIEQRRLIHFQLTRGVPTPQEAERIARVGVRKVAGSAPEWVWGSGSKGPAGLAQALRGT